ncbi:MAG: response regulator [Emcibacter sp.]|nr:response regulator [Emcibacter sp.]
MNQRNNILLIDDDDISRAALAEQLTFHENFIITEAGTGVNGLNAAKKHKFDLILLNADLPDGDGLDILRMIRDAKIKTPIILLTTEENGHTGADDYVTKPIQLGILLAAIRAQLRKYGRKNGASS